MASLGDLVARFCNEERAAANILDEWGIFAQARAATLFYSGYAHIGSKPSEIDETTQLSDSEWAIIRPLFVLYVERETALQLEASRGLGMDVFGRSTSEIAADVAVLEQELPKRAFYQDIVTV